MVVLFSACAGGVIELSEFTLFLRHQAKEAERKLKVPSLSPLYILYATQFSVWGVALILQQTLQSLSLCFFYSLTTTAVVPLTATAAIYLSRSPCRS